jgi:autoinducer 2-degrading protein
MIVRVITIHVHPDRVEEFKEATVKNRAGSIQEPGILRFDVLQNQDNREEFLLYEVYGSQEATAAHKETAHYKEWKARVEPMMAGPRSGPAFSPIEPVNQEEW